MEKALTKGFSLEDLGIRAGSKSKALQRPLMGKKGGIVSGFHLEFRNYGTERKMADYGVRVRLKGKPDERTMGDLELIGARRETSVELKTTRDKGVDSYYIEISKTDYLKSEEKLVFARVRNVEAEARAILKERKLI